MGIGQVFAGPQNPMLVLVRLWSEGRALLPLPAGTVPPALRLGPLAASPCFLFSTCLLAQSLGITRLMEFLSESFSLFVEGGSLAQKVTGWTVALPVSPTQGCLGVGGL